MVGGRGRVVVRSTLKQGYIVAEHEQSVAALQRNLSQNAMLHQIIDQG